MLAIRNFGLLWDRDRIHFGSPGVSGHLIGENSRVKKADFRKQSGVYILYDKDMRPVYVGQAGRGNANLFSRLRHHDRDHLWNRWEYFSWFGLCKVNNNGELSMSDNADRSISGKVKDALNEIEGVLILILEPRLNKQGPKWKDAEEFFQYIDKEVEDTTVL
ncbi:GIY-YIG nuclease family protein, partial [Nitrospira defluvii]|nr:GIY-YIG nuclease family protein [Nitrospira defluvii]